MFSWAFYFCAGGSSSGYVRVFGVCAGGLRGELICGFWFVGGICANRKWAWSCGGAFVGVMGWVLVWHGCGFVLCFNSLRSAGGWLIKAGRLFILAGHCFIKKGLKNINAGACLLKAGRLFKVAGHLFILTGRCFICAGGLFINHGGTK